MATEEQLTGAEDWRSEVEKQKSMLHKAVASLFKTWIPDHPEGSHERGEVYAHFRSAMLDGTKGALTLETMLSQGSEDILGHEYLDVPLSMQELLVKRAGSDAFLDAKSALKLVRRKFNMMTMVGRMASTMEQRNIAAISLKGDINQEELIKFGRLMSGRIDGTALEEEAEFKKKLRRERYSKVEVLFHSQMVGRRMPVPWRVKHAYTLLSLAIRKNEDGHSAAQRLAEQRLNIFTAKELRQLALYAPELAEELDAPGAYDPVAVFLMAAEEQPLLNAARNIFNEFRELRVEQQRERAPEGTVDMSASEMHGDDAEELDKAEIEAALKDDFLDQVDADDDDFLQLAKALELVRTVRGPEFFSRISMVSGDVSFVATAMGSGFADVEQAVAQLDPKEGLRKALSVTEPFFRARALSAVVAQLIEGQFQDEAEQAADAALEAARQCQTADVDQAYTAALTALLTVGQESRAGVAVSEALERAHDHEALDERAASLMRVVSTLMEAGPLPASVRTTLSKAILGKDIHFWGKPEVSPALVEVILALLTGNDEDTLIVLQKVVAHPNVDVRRSVIRAMPFDSEELQNILLSHLRDLDPAVRIEVAERVGYTGDRKLGLYLQNHVRQGHPETIGEKRSVAMNLARLDPTRFTPLFNSMLGKLATDGAGLTDKFKPIKDDKDWQLAALEVLYHLNSQQARRLVFNAAKRAKGDLKEPLNRLFEIVRRKSYGEPSLPRSRHDPDWNEEDDENLFMIIEREWASTEKDAPKDQDEDGAEADGEAPSEEPVSEPKKGGLFNRIKARIFKADTASPEVLDAEEATPEDEDAEQEAEEAGPEELVTSPAGETQSYTGPPRAALRFEAALQEGEQACEGPLPMVFTLYGAADAAEPFWRESHQAVVLESGRFEVDLGLSGDRLPDAIPTEVWLGIAIDGGDELQPRTRLSRARSVVQG